MSETNKNIVDRHRSNEMLSAPFLSSVPREEKDMSVEHPASTPKERLFDEVEQGLRAGQTHYVDVPGMPALREALMEYLGSLGVSQYEQKNLAVTASMQESRFLSLQVIAEDLDRIAIPEVVHPGVRKAIGARPTEVSTFSVNPYEGMLPTIDGIREALSSGAKLIYLESPVRLTGATFSADALQQVAELLADSNAFAIIDQGLCPWVPGTYASFGAVDDASKRVTLIGEAFPGFGLEAWGVGYLATNEEWFAGISKLKQVMAICTSTPSQLAALQASEEYEARRKDLQKQMSERRQSAVEAAQAANIDVVEGRVSSLLALRPARLKASKEALTKAGYRFGDGAMFGAPEIVRLAMTDEDALRSAIEQLQ